MADLLVVMTKWSFCTCVLLPVLTLSSSITEDIGIHRHMKYQIRLVGDAPYKGRLEVFHRGEWGTVCDDNFTPYGCSLVCKQLGFRNGTCLSLVNSRCLLKEGDFEFGTGRIWLDDVMCNGYELGLDECQHSPWGMISCFHDGDVGCICTPHQEQCNSSRHRIVPIDDRMPSVGIVEIQDENGAWGAVCDDSWDDLDAVIFCECLGYKNVDSFRAMSVGRPTDAILNYRGSFLIDEVHCPNDDYHIKNLWDCAITVNRPSHCSIPNELAIVQCENYDFETGSGEEELDRINSSVQCDGRTLVMCVHPFFKFKVGQAQLELRPPCKWAALRDYDDQLGFCYDIDLLLCSSIGNGQRVMEVKSYCFDVSFKVPGHLFFLGDVTRRGCCSLSKHLRVEASFPAPYPPAVDLELPVFDSIHPSLSIPCFQKDSSELKEIAGGSAVGRGSTVYCKVVADLWDHDLQLVVQNCKFIGDLDSARVSEYTFIKDKCVVTKLLDVKLFNEGKHSWGLSFYFPKFESMENVHLTCDVFLCDVKKDGKQLCDRSCNFERFSPLPHISALKSTQISTFKSTPKSTLKSTPKSTLKSTPKSTLKSTPKSTPTSTLKSTPKSTPTSTPRSTMKSTPKLTPKSTPKSTVYTSRSETFEVSQDQDPDDQDTESGGASNGDGGSGHGVPAGSLAATLKRSKREAQSGERMKMFEAVSGNSIRVRDTGEGPLLLRTGLLISEKSPATQDNLGARCVVLFLVAVFILFCWFLLQKYLN